jgi:hypothetical protein
MLRLLYGEPEMDTSHANHTADLWHARQHPHPAIRWLLPAHACLGVSAFYAEGTGTARALRRAVDKLQLRPYAVSHPHEAHPK